MTQEQAAFWRAFEAATGHRGAPVDVDAFGDTPDLQNELAALVLSGRKRATCGLARWFEGDDAPRSPRAGDRSLVLDGDGRPVCVIETTSVIVQPVEAVDDAFAWDEGEGDRTRAWWLEAHRAFFTREAEREGFVYSDAMRAVFERFCVIWPPDAADGDRAAP